MDLTFQHPTTTNPAIHATPPRQPPAVHDRDNAVDQSSDMNDTGDVSTLVEEFQYLAPLMGTDGDESTSRQASAPKAAPARKAAPVYYFGKDHVEAMRAVIASHLGDPRLHQERALILHHKINLFRELDRLSNAINELSSDLALLASVNRLRFWTGRTQADDCRHFITTLQMLVDSMGKATQECGDMFASGLPRPLRTTKEPPHHRRFSVWQMLRYSVPGLTQIMAAHAENLHVVLVDLQEIVQMGLVSERCFFHPSLLRGSRKL